jgi:hypothetical protein
MNFFGHAVVARRVSEDPGFVLGAMLPDFAAMAGAKIRRIDDPEIAAGVENHHQTDRAFHDAPTFRRLCAAGGEALRARGLRHASSLAVAHVGIEILLDGALTDDVGACRAYLLAVEAGARDARGRAITWWAPEHGVRWDALRGRLLARGVPSDLDPSLVCERLAIALARRPRLAFEARDRAAVEQWLRQTTPRVAESRDGLMSELQLRMDQAS